MKTAAPVALGIWIATVLSVGAPLASGAEKPGGKPNFLIILSDDHGVGDLGCYGNPVIHTPNLDRLAGDGMRFTRAFTPTAMCTPSRSALYTGLFPHRNGAHPNHSATRKGVKSLPMYLKPLGYRVALSGKTHIKPKSVYPFEYIQRTGKEIAGFLRDAGGGPFCLVIATHHPHKEWVAPEPGEGHDPADIPVPPHLVDTPQTRLDMRDYYNSIEILDGDVAAYLAILEKLSLADNTLVFYMGDHGAQLPFGKWTLYDAGIRVPFLVRWPGKVKPGTTTDAMVSFVDVLPTLIEAAGGMPPEDIDGRSFLGVLTGEKTGHRDLIFGTHTSLGIISGSEFPIRAVRSEKHKYIRNLNHEGRFTNITTDGRRLGPKKQKESRRERSGPGPLWQAWLAAAEKDPAVARRVEFYQKRPAEELYDLQADPHELNNLADDPRYKEVKAELRKQLDGWMRQQGDPLAGR